MKLVDLNVCIKLDNTKEVIEFLKSNESDVTTLQEVTRHFEDSAFEEYKIKYHIEKALPEFKYNFFGPLFYANCIEKDGQVNKDFGGYIEQGNQTLSKHPIIEASNNFYYNNYTYGFDATNFRTDDLCRAVQIGTIDINGKLVRIINVHGIWNKDRIGNERTIHQSNFIIKTALEKDLPTIIVGDFNLSPESESIKLINEKFTNLINVYNIKSTRPSFDDGLDVGNNVVDYIFVNDKIKVNDFKVPNVDVSDHLPLLLDFDIID